MRQYSFKEFMRYYSKRLIIPWLLAVLVYYMLRVAINNKTVGFMSLLSEYLFPYYHLWYVPAFLVYALIGYELVHIKGKSAKYVMAGLLVVCSILLFFVDLQSAGGNYIISKVLHVVGYTIRPQFISFFLLGIACKKKTGGRLLALNRKGRFGCLALSLSIIIVCFFVNNKIVQTTVNVVASIMIFLSSVSFCLQNTIITNKIGRMVTYAGRNSFPIYLWHMIGLIIVTPLRNRNMVFLYYVLAISWILILLLFLKSRKSKLLIEITGR